MIRKLLLFSCVVFLITAFIPKKKKEFLPPGTIKINDTLFADETEVSNLSWQGYTFVVKEKYGVNSAEYLAVLPDTSVWLWGGMNSNEPYVSLYRCHFIYHDYPAVGITYEQAIAYCKWRTEIVKKLNAEKYPGAEFEYRLPSKQEWESLASIANEVFGQKNEVVFRKIDKDHEECEFKYKANCYVQCPADSNNVCNILAPRRIKSFKPNSYKLYDIIGNVSEMVLEKGISKGGSWKHTLEESRVGKDITYEKPTAWLGFRCVCVVKKKSSNS